MSPTPPETELTPELIDRVMSLTPEGRGRLMELICEADLPSGPDAEEIARRLNSVVAGTAKTITREESDEAIRQAMRSHGIEL